MTMGLENLSLPDSIGKSRNWSACFLDHPVKPDDDTMSWMMTSDCRKRVGPLDSLYHPATPRGICGRDSQISGHFNLTHQEEGV